eukprot:2311180-Amphidinium_carterae.1
MAHARCEDELRQYRLADVRRLDCRRLNTASLIRATVQYRITDTLLSRSLHTVWITLGAISDVQKG